MHPYYPPGAQKNQFNAGNVYGYGFVQPTSAPRASNFMAPNTFNPNLPGGFYRPNFNAMRASGPMQGMYNEASTAFQRGSQQPTTMDDPRQQKVLMEKMMKERNYQVQQQRLRDFNPSHSKLKADKLIENVMGKLGSEPLTAGKESGGMKSKMEEKSSSSVRGVSFTASKTSLAPSASVKSGQKARDWSSLGDLEQMFTTSTSESSSDLPLWCQEGSTIVPAAYLEVERCVTRDGKIDTNLVYPILLSSGLSREMLGRVWALANRETPGVLSRSELYAILAMIGLVQNACEVYSISILNSVPHPPIPRLNVVNNYALQMGQSNTAIQQQQQQQEQTFQQLTVVTSSVDDFDDFQSASTDTASPVLTATTFSATVGSRLANYDLTRTAEQQQVQPEHDESSKNQDVLFDLMEPLEDKYGIFRLIEPTPSFTNNYGSSASIVEEPKVNVNSLEENISHLNLSEDFDEFQWHLPPPPPASTNATATVPDYTILEFVPDEDDDDEFGDFAGAEAIVTGNGGGNLVAGFLGPSPLQSEVQSVASLDLGIVDTRSETPPVTGQPDFGIKSENDVVESSLTLTDRYSFLKRDSERSASQDNCHAYEWRRCLDNCYQIIKNALDVFNQGSSSGVCHEVITCEEGENFIKSIIEIYRVACRISRWVQLLQGEDKHLLEASVSSIDDEWNRLLPFIVASPVVPSEGKSGFSKRHQSDQAAAKPCGVCLMSVDHCDDDCAPHLNLAQLTYGGRMYHATCANFWVNCIDSKLPSLPVLF